MGMGEPFLNYDNVLESIRILNDRDGFNLGARHFSISTAGIVGEIKKLAEEPLQINLAISLHAPTDELRSKLMPIGKKYTIKKILSAVDKYIAKTNRKVMFEYIMIDGVNDSEKQARQLVKLMNPSASCCRQTKRPLYHIRQAQCKFINLILCNPIGDFRPSPQERIEKFKKILKDAGIQVNQRYSFGQDISAACGQLSWPAGN
ncbi:MAG: radical SAM protein [Candidatus Portnoybacteria bacterium]|nr:radical SAM protein [Candidatus Portnoybacteria bacterium]